MFICINFANNILDNIFGCWNFIIVNVEVTIFQIFFAFGDLFLDLDFLELVDGGKLIHGVGQILNYLALLLVKDGQHKVHSREQRNLHGLFY